MSNEAKSMKNKFKRLRIFNGVMGVLHLLQATLMFVLSTDFTLPVTNTYQAGPPGSGAMTTEILFNLTVGPAIALFLLISAIFHFGIASFLYDWYVEKLKQNINHLRWIEYSISSSIMIVVIAMLVGFSDIGVLLMIFVLNASMIFFGWLMELYNQKTERTRWSPFIFGCIAGAIPWFAIAIRLVTAINNSPVEVPGFVIAIFISIGIFFNIFALNQLLQYKKVGPWGNYLFGEKMYIVLSLVAKSALAWQIFTGTLM
ncbi:MAG: heliorhodopsin HeR [Candidatus Paceibacterota bacterium]